MLKRGEQLRSLNGKYIALMQNDGKFVVFDENKSITFETETRNMGEYLIMQDDGNLVIYKRHNEIIQTEQRRRLYSIWDTHTQGKGDRLILQDDGNLVVYDVNNKFQWALW